MSVIWLEIHEPIKCQFKMAFHSKLNILSNKQHSDKRNECVGVWLPLAGRSHSTYNKIVCIKFAVLRLCE